MTKLLFTCLVLGVGVLFLSPCSDPSPGGTYIDGSTGPSGVSRPTAQVREWMKLPRKPASLRHDGSLSHAVMLRDADLPNGRAFDWQDCIVIQEEPYVSVQGTLGRVQKDRSNGGRVERLVARGGARFNVVDSGGFYCGLAEAIQYRGDRHDLILEGSPVIKCGTTTFMGGPKSLMRVDLATGAIFESGGVTESHQ